METVKIIDQDHVKSYLKDDMNDECHIKSKMDLVQFGKNEGCNKSC